MVEVAGMDSYLEALRRIQAQLATNTKDEVIIALARQLKAILDDPEFVRLLA